MVSTTEPPAPADSLSSRHRALNQKVIDAVASKIDFSTVKDQIEVSEVDKFFKIDLAAKCKNFDYIVEILKSGNTLYATRALKKSKWLYDEEYSHVINPEFLDSNIFSVTSARVKRLILKTVAMRVRKEDRAIGFFKYCMKTNLPEIAFKCLLFTSESFKLDLMRNHNKPPFDKIIKKKIEYFQFIVGDSLTLLEAYLGMKDVKTNAILIKFNYLYHVDNIKYLELCEKYDAYSTFDTDMCNDIMTKYKDRVMAKPLYYLEHVDSNILLKYSTADDAKAYIIARLPPDAETFWSTWFIPKNADYIDLIPESERHAFLKKLYNEKYPGEDFELTKSFYTQHCHKFMTAEEKEEWALNLIKSDKQVLGVGKDYVWYKFVNFKDAFEEIKKYVIVTKDAERRKGQICVLVNSAKNNRDLTILFKHYHRRHNNELRAHKEYFLHRVVSYQNVFEFDEECWNAFYILLLSMELYNTLDYEHDNDRYKNVVLFYHIVHEKDLPEGLYEYLHDYFIPERGCGNLDPQSIYYLLEKLSESKRQCVYDFLFEFYTSRIKELKNEKFTTKNYKKIERYFKTVQELMYVFNPCYEEYEYEPWRHVHSPKDRKNNRNLMARQLLQALKKDKTLVLDKRTDVKKSFATSSSKIDCFLKKIKVYFSGDDVTKTFIDLFEEILEGDDINQKIVNACVSAIFELSDGTAIEEFMKKYAPQSPKINRHDIDPAILRIQKAICRFACFAKPPVSLSTMLLYMKGDYMPHCLHVFNTYPAILPPSKCIEFVKALIDSPVSIQKHALRLAFKCFETHKLKDISLEFWNKTKNVSVRCVIYKGIYNRLVETNDNEVFNVLKLLTFDLHEDDDKALFRLVESNTLSDEYLGQYKEAAWSSISKFRDRQPNITRKCNLLTSIQENINLMSEEFVSKIVKEHLELMLNENNLYLCKTNEEISKIYTTKWDFTSVYIIHFATTRDDIGKYLEAVQFVVKKCIEMWYKTYDGNYIYQERCWEFYRQLKEESYHHNHLLYENSLPVFESILMTVESDLPIFESYMLIWELELAIMIRKILKGYRKRINKNVQTEVVTGALVDFSIAVKSLISDMIKDNTYFVTNTEKVQDVVNNNIVDILDVIYTESDEDQSCYVNKALITFTTELVSLEIVEIYLLAIQLLPVDCNECLSAEYQTLIDKIQDQNNSQVKFTLHQKLQKYCKGKPI